MASLNINIAIPITNILPNIKNDYLKEIKKENEKIYNSENN